MAQLLQEYDGPFERAIAAIEHQYTPEQIGHFCEVLQTFTQQFTEEIQHAIPSDL